MNSILCFLIMLPILFCPHSRAIAQVSAEQCAATIKYANRNQSDPKPLVLNEALGQVVLEGGKPVSNLGPARGACLGIFTEKEHKLVATATTDRRGHFKFNDILPGEYRLVVRYDPFCIANVPFIITAKSASKGKRLIIHMCPVSPDECSYGELRSGE